ncbi:MAG: AmmeMemoRadiSam system protein A [Arhodomonas sp.]|nr:AmmeMemoRadiSam system protein A [Arhodomonas sp.]
MSGSGNASLAAHRDALFTLAEASIDHGLSYGLPRLPDGETVPEALQRERSAFVTLFHAGELRGCIGSLEPRRALAEEVAANAFAAAFRDPRFPPLTEQERPGLSLKIEVLGPAEPIEFRDEAELLARLRPARTA